jgi:hypothetical protein
MTESERIFLERMAPHILAGKSFAEAGRAVLEDDERIWLAAMSNTEQGAAIRGAMARQVYERIRAS